MAEAVEVEGGGRMVAEDEADPTGAQRTAYDPHAVAGDVIVYRISGAFFFGATAAVSAVLDRIGERPRIFVLDFTDVPLVDSTARKRLQGFVKRLSRAGQRVYFAGTRHRVREALFAAGLTPPLVNYKADVQAALTSAKKPRGES